MNPLNQLLEVLTLGQSQIVTLANQLNGDAYVINSQLISAFSNGGTLLFTSLGQVFGQLPALPIPGL
jgi:hypothetical protein